MKAFQLLAALLGALGLTACADERGVVATRTDTVSHPSVTRPAVPPAEPQVTPPAVDTIRADLAGVGPVRFGMTTAAAATALGAPLPGALPGEGCSVWRPAGAPAGLGFMIENGKVVRFDVDSGAIATDSGVAIGTPVDRVRSAYGARIAETPHKYRWDRGWRYLTVFSPDSERALVFEADSHAVRSFHAGLALQAQYVERCS